MQSVVRLARSSSRAPFRRCLATTAAPSADALSSSSASSVSSRSAAIPLSNVEAQWARLTSEEKVAVHEQLEVLQQKDWKELTIDEKKAAYYVAFGPHGPRTPTSQPGDSLKILLATGALLGAAGVLFYAARALGNPPPKTLTKEWQEATNERALEMKLNPITGISSEGYKGKGFVQST
ncbi:cytochrome c oxidase subunit IV-domain-containing protein [Crucibulum laeve]|uniref:Cytochrome c oxidase subunit IV-domain-containing protein n=1 Tax=Crucibulum laeve TaxID=68775 RepID=A0A5C3LU41_9AGAR|nr:cytochrome c oxidase subunit IV-domain-containing protein [Crucibulum laeve]